MVKVLHIVGARPQFVKLSPLYNCMKKNNFKQKILHTGQHYDQNMSKIFFSKFNIPMPDFNLNINQLNHGAMTGRMIEMIEKILILEDLDYIIVYGDTNSTLSGSTRSLIATKLIFAFIFFAARTTERPIRPNPFIATLMSFIAHPIIFIRPQT